MVRSLSRVRVTNQKHPSRVLNLKDIQARNLTEILYSLEFRVS